MAFRVPEKHRVQVPGMVPSQPGDMFGVFMWKWESMPGAIVRAIAAKGEGWEHVSVSIAMELDDERVAFRMPAWSDMCRVKALFWEPEDTVMQLHPPESQYVNDHPGVLHLWRPEGQPIPLPPRIFV